MTPSSSPKARRLGMMLALCLVIEASAPAPALAWFGWLDKWSGPGNFWGLLYEVRLVCFGPDSDVEEIITAYQRAQRSTRLVLAPSQPAPPDRSQQAVAIPLPISVVPDWLAAFTLLHEAQIRWNAPVTNRRAVSDMIRRLEKRDVISVTEVDKIMRQSIESRAGRMATIAASGMFWSACSDEKERRLSIELNVNDWHGFKNENNNNFSGGTSVRFVTVMPSVTWRIFANQKADVVDVGIAAGYYAFSSQGFESVRGFIVEPLRIDLHAPTSWAAYPRTDARRLAAMFTFRAGLMTIPTGLAANAFAPGSQDGPIPAEIVPTIGLFFNLNSLLSKKNLAPTIP